MASNDVEPPSDLQVIFKWEEDGMLLTISKAGFPIYSLYLEDICKNYSKKALARLAENLSENFFNIEDQLQVIKHAERSWNKRKHLLM